MCQKTMHPFLFFPSQKKTFSQSAMKNWITVQEYESPCGVLLLGTMGGKLCLCNWTESRCRIKVEDRVARLLQAEYRLGSDDTLTMAVRQLDEYFAGRRQVFDLSLLPVGTEFQLSVWRELLNIPYGGICTYTVQAERLAMPRAVRAVAAANGQNALSIFIPCHRVIGRNGRLTGYAGGLEAKHFLLELEAVHAPQVRALNTGAAF